MPKANRKKREPEMADHYDFTGGVRGKYAARLAREGSNLVLLDADVAKAFPTSEAVNKALRKLASERKSRSVGSLTGRRRRAG